MVSNVLLGGLAGYYLQTNFITFDEAEEVEKEWRLIFNRLFNRDISTPRAELYSPTAEGGHHRKHIWSVGIASLWSCMERAMAGALHEQHALVASSAVAMSLERWGCCGDPNTWNFTHLEEQLTIATGGVTRYLGDCWMLCTIMLERQSRARSVRGEPGAHRADVLAERRAQLGRWIRHGLAAPCKALAADAPAWQVGDSARLFEPAGMGGLGIAVSRELLDAGVRVLAHMCDDGGAYIGSFEDARTANKRLRASASAEWHRVMAWLQGARVAPV